MSFFINKIRDIRTDIMEFSIYQPECDRENRSLQCTDTVVRQELMTSFSNKTCFLDPIPTLVVKDNIDFRSTCVKRNCAAISNSGKIFQLP